MEENFYCNLFYFSFSCLRFVVLFLLPERHYKKVKAIFFIYLYVCTKRTFLNNINCSRIFCPFLLIHLSYLIVHGALYKYSTLIVHFICPARYDLCNDGRANILHILKFSINYNTGAKKSKSKFIWT